jgi:hypothetical protein
MPASKFLSAEIIFSARVTILETLYVRSIMNNIGHDTTTKTLYSIGCNVIFVSVSSADTILRIQKIDYFSYRLFPVDTQNRFSKIKKIRA